MFIFEHDAKVLLEAFGTAVPQGCWVGAGGIVDGTLPTGALIVKAQVAGGGRGKAGGIQRAADAPAALEAAGQLMAAPLAGLPVAGCRVEQAIAGAREVYLSLTLDASRAQVQVLACDEGGMDIEAVDPAALVREWAGLDAASIVEAVDRAAQRLSPANRAPVAEAGACLAAAFTALDAQMIEVNPLFVLAQAGGPGWLAADGKLITDDNALYRQPLLSALVERAAARYPEAARKWRHGCDYVVVDPEGEIALLTTGAGLSMMLIDELRAQDLRPYNFLDVRTGGLRGDPKRLVDVLGWMREGRRVRVLLVNIFAGITHLGEFSRLLVRAMDAVPAFDVPVVARLAGPGFDEAVEVLGARGVKVERDLSLAIDAVRRTLAEGASTRTAL
ncbi:MAG: ATP-grasp domain-containing protein [Pseudomonadota bacterium]